MKVTGRSPAVLQTLVVALALLTCSQANMNVLLLIADDMRTELGVYDNPDFPDAHPDVLTPNLDQLAASSLLLKSAHCQNAACNPSRSSFLTGRRSETTHIYEFKDGDFRERGGDFCTIPQYFKDNGYRSIGMGKIFHDNLGDDPPSWSEDYYHAPNYDYWQSYNSSWRSVTPAEQQARPLPDEQIRDHAIEKLREVADDEEPFFLAVGFYKPHLPFTFPEGYADLYPMDEVLYPVNPHVPEGMPEMAWFGYWELQQYGDIAAIEEVTGAYNTSLPDDLMMDLRRAYISCVTYVDDMIGQVLTELDELGLSDNTIVAFLSDHGYHLGEHSEWTKVTNMDRATHTPMMLRVPGITTEGGIVSNELIELVDLFPTLVEVAGLEKPTLCPEDSSDIYACVEGDSMLPLFSDPAEPTWKKSVFTEASRRSNLVMGFSIRTERYRYTEWVAFNETLHQPDWDTMFGVELYDHYTTLEDVNVVSDPQYEEDIEELSEQLRAGWREVPRG